MSNRLARPPAHATTNTVNTAATISTVVTGWSSVEANSTGLMTSFPEVLRPPPSNSSGAWTLTSSDFSGTLSVRLQLGHGPDFPANLSLTLKLLRQPGQTTMIDMR